MGEDILCEVLKSIKTDIKDCINYLKNYAQKYNYKLKQVDEDFFTYILKHIIFFKKIYLCNNNNKYFYKVIISDLFYYILAIISGKNRYIFLNERSIIENYVRIVTNTSVNENHVTDKVFNILKDKKFEFDYSIDDYSLIKSEYRHSCGFIHGAKILNESLSFCFFECEKCDELKNKEKYFQTVKKIIKIFDKMIISEYCDMIDISFFNEKTTLQYLLGKDCLELLFKIKK